MPTIRFIVSLTETYVKTKNKCFRKSLCKS